MLKCLLRKKIRTSARTTYFRPYRRFGCNLNVLFSGNECVSPTFFNSSPDPTKLANQLLPKNPITLPPSPPIVRQIISVPAQSKMNQAH